MTETCACGCGQPVAQSNVRHHGEAATTRAVRRRFVHGHNRRGAMPADVRRAMETVRADPVAWRAFIAEELPKWAADDPDAAARLVIDLLDLLNDRAPVVAAAQHYVDALGALWHARGLLPPEGNALVAATDALVSSVAVYRDVVDTRSASSAAGET